jgi:hypothetical protein
MDYAAKQPASMEIATSLMALVTGTPSEVDGTLLVALSFPNAG